jgi:HemY protein
VKKLIFGLVVLVLAGLASYFLGDYLTTESDKGQVIIGIGTYNIETTFYVFAIALSLAFILLYLLARAFTLLMKSPAMIRESSLTKKQSLSQQALVDSLVDSAEGHWEKAENTLIKHATNSATPLIHYLTAARTAQSRGAFEKRNDYLRQAYNSTPDSDVIVGITKAELHLSADEYDQAVDTLTRLDQISPDHPIVQRLLHDTYEKLNDWEAIHQLLPDLQKNKKLVDMDLKTTEQQSYRERLKQTVSSNNPEQIKDFWNTAPKHIKRNPEINAIYFASMIESNNSQEIEKELHSALAKNWDISLIKLLAEIESSEPDKQLKQTQKYLKKHADDAMLHCILGRICLRQNKLEEAATYLKISIQLQPSVSAYQLMGDLLTQQSQLQAANDYFRKGLLLRSDTTAQEVSTIQTDEQPVDQLIQPETETMEVSQEHSTA